METDLRGARQQLDSMRERSLAHATEVNRLRAALRQDRAERDRQEGGDFMERVFLSTVSHTHPDDLPDVAATYLKLVHSALDRLKEPNQERNDNESDSSFGSDTP